MKKKLFVLSLDALGYIDEEVYKNLSFFKKCIEKGTWIRRLKSIYPTLTYPIHSTIVSGRYPVSHGIDNNLKLEPENLVMNWYWDEENLKGDSIFRAARRKGLKSAAFRWPATGFADIDFNFPEVWSLEGEDLYTHMSKKGTKEFVEELKEKFGEFTGEMPQRIKDEYICKAAAYTFEKYSPDITFMHLVDVDGKKHIYGSRHLGIDIAIKNLNDNLELLFGEIDKVQRLEDINIILLSDHSQIDTFTGIRLNKMLANMGLLVPEEDGTTKDYKAYFLSCGGSAALYLRNPEDVELVEKIKLEIENLNCEGIEKIFSKEDILNLGASDKAILWVEAKEGYAFEASASGEVFDLDRPLDHVGNHGFLPDKENNLSIGIFVGPDFKAGHVIEDAEMINIAPTINEILDLNLEGMVSTPITEALK